MPGGSRRPDPTKCKSGRHEWIPENIVVKRGVNICHVCLLEGQRNRARERRALARQLGEVALIDRLNLTVAYWPRVSKQENGCWIWKGCVDGAGYGYVSVLNRPINTHRIAYRLAHGDIPAKHEICHSCDAPLCVNPDHLFAATHAENMRDMREKGRWPGFPNHFDENGNRKVC